MAIASPRLNEVIMIVNSDVQSKQKDIDEITTASSSKLEASVKNSYEFVEAIDELKGNRMFDLKTLISVFSMLCCPACLQTNLELKEDSRFGICSNFCLICKRGHKIGFPSTPNINNKNVLNSLLVLGLRLIGKGFTADQKLISSLNLSKAAFRNHEGQLLTAVKYVSDQTMNEASQEVKILKKRGDWDLRIDLAAARSHIT